MKEKKEDGGNKMDYDNDGLYKIFFSTICVHTSYAPCSIHSWLWLWHSRLSLSLSSGTQSGVKCNGLFKSKLETKKNVKKWMCVVLCATATHVRQDGDNEKKLDVKVMQYKPQQCFPFPFPVFPCTTHFNNLIHITYGWITTCTTKASIQDIKLTITRKCTLHCCYRWKGRHLSFATLTQVLLVVVGWRRRKKTSQ